MEKGVCYVNGVISALDHAKLPVLDLAVVRGYGVFDFLRTYNRRPFHLWEHLERLRFSAEQIGLNLPLSLHQIQEIVLQLLGQVNFPESNIKILLTGGMSPDQFLPNEEPSLVIFVYPYKAHPSSSYTQGIKVVTTSLARSLPTSKTLQYTPGIVALLKGKAKGASEALYLNDRAEILEATTCNFFAIKDNTLITCDTDEVLFGITREIVLNLVKDRFDLDFRTLPLAEISKIDEIFITSSTRDVMPVIQIDEQIIGDGKVGPKTKQIMQLFKDYTNLDSWRPLEILRYQELKQNT